MPDVRLFIALELPADVRRELARWAAGAVADDPALRPAREEALHVTLAFLGHRPQDEVAALAEAIRLTAAAAGGPLSLALREAVWFDPRRPRVLAVVLHDASGALGELHDLLWERLEPLGHRRERRRFRPHVTVARVRHRATPLRRELPAVAARPFAAVDLTLMRSHLQGGAPAVYEPLERVALGGALPRS